MLVKKTQKWRCDTRKYESSKRQSVKYKIRHDGVYAVIFLPDLPPEQFRVERYCGILCKDKRLVFILMFVGLPCLLAILFVFYKL